MWTSEHAQALRDVFNDLTQSEIPWMVAKNYEGLPNLNYSKDVDILVDKKFFLKAHKTISSALKAHYFNRVVMVEYPNALCSVFFNTSRGCCYSIKIDLVNGVSWRGASFLSFFDLYKKREKKLDFFVSGEFLNGFLLWFYPLIMGAGIKKKYQDIILRTIAQFSEGFQELLVDMCGKKLSTKIWLILKSGALEGTVKLKSQLCVTAWWIAFLKSPPSTFLATVEYFHKEVVRRLHRPRASMLAVVGPDGSGKSTFVEAFQKELENILVRDPEGFCVLHFRPNIFPNIKKLLGGKKYDETKEEFTSPHRAKPAGFVGSIIRIVYYWLDYVVGYWVRVRSKCVAGKIFIFDRYFYDFIADPYRARINLPVWLRLLFLKLTPQPDIVFFLNCDAKTIYTRKQELELNEIERQLCVYRKLANNSRRFVILDAGKSAEELCATAVRQVIERSFNEL